MNFNAILITFALEIAQKGRLAINTYLGNPFPSGFVPAHTTEQQGGEEGQIEIEYLIGHVKTMWKFRRYTNDF
jgi:hypothetical protein